MRRWNALGRVTIHAVGIGFPNRNQNRPNRPNNRPNRPNRPNQPRLGRAEQFLHDLAEQNGGRFVSAR